MTKISVRFSSSLLFFAFCRVVLGRGNTTAVPKLGGGNTTLFDEHKQFSTFELFKNTKLFYPCPNSTQAASNTLSKWKGGGRGGGGGCGGGGGESLGVPSLVSIKWVQNEAEYCNALSGNVVMIPTLPNADCLLSLLRVPSSTV